LLVSRPGFACMQGYKEEEKKEKKDIIRVKK
jgi:hypothetical protein